MEEWKKDTIMYMQCCIDTSTSDTIEVGKQYNVYSKL